MSRPWRTWLLFQVGLAVTLTLAAAWRAVPPWCPVCAWGGACCTIISEQMRIR